MKDEVKIYEYDKLDKKLLNHLLFLLFLLKLTILKNELLFYITNNIKIYYFLLFIYVRTFSTKTYDFTLQTSY